MSPSGGPGPPAPAPADDAATAGQVDDALRTPNAGVAPRSAGAWLAAVLCALLVAGGLQLGVLGLTGFDTLAAVFGEHRGVLRVAQAAIGVAAVLVLLLLRLWGRHHAPPPFSRGRSDRGSSP